MSLYQPTYLPDGREISHVSHVVCTVAGCTCYPAYISRFSGAYAMWCEVHAFVFAVGHHGAQWARGAAVHVEADEEEEVEPEADEATAPESLVQMELFR